MARRTHETLVKRPNECRCGLGIKSLDILTIFMVSFLVFRVSLKVERPKKLEAGGEQLELFHTKTLLLA